VATPGAGHQPLNFRSDSGGPLFLGDKAIGVVTYIYRPTKATESLNFAIHYSEVARFIKDNLPPP
jgi:S1-C subfamily serine protease